MTRVTRCTSAEISKRRQWPPLTGWNRLDGARVDIDDPPIGTHVEPRHSLEKHHVPLVVLHPPLAERLRPRGRPAPLPAKSSRLDATSL